MADDNTAGTLVKCVVGIAQEMGLDKKLMQILGLGGDKPLTAEDIAEAVRQQVVQAFFQQDVDAEIITAGGELATAREFLSVNYQSDIDNQFTNAQLYAILSGDDASGMQRLINAANALEGWIAAAQDQNQPIYAAKAMPVWIDIWLHVCLFYNEMAKVAEDDHHRDAALETMRTYARNSLATISGYFVQIWNKRAGSLSYVVDNDWLYAQYAVSTRTIHDQWFLGGASAIRQYVLDPVDNPAFAFNHVQAIYDTYYWVLWEADVQAVQNMRALIQDFVNDSKGDFEGWNNDFLNQSFDSVEKFGQWSSGVRAQLLELDLIASSVTGTAQDNWNWCQHCGVLFLADSSHQHCPGSPAGRDQFGHWQKQSGNYVLRCDSPGAAVPANMQDNWRWCVNCGELFFGLGPSVCPNSALNPINPNAPHDATGSGNYMLGYGAIPAAAQRGFDAQDGWRYCKNCGGLHFPAAGAGTASACPAGGAHATDGSANYWLPHFGSPARTGAEFFFNWSP